MTASGAESGVRAARAQAQPAGLLSGEVHYWRVPRGSWDAVLASARELGVECIGTYVPWQHHEREPGQYDFGELLEFVERVRAHGLALFARPGPLIYAEWRNLGLPDHAVPFARHDARFRERAERWIAAVLDALKPYFGAPIVLLQADNEIDPMPHVYGEDQGFGTWLERRYGSVERLNAAWGASYRSFGEPLPTLVPFVEDARYRDGQRYRYELATDYARWVVGRYRERCGSMPLALNSWPFVNAQHWRDLADLVEVYGIDPYPENECATSFRELREQFRLLRAVTRQPFVAELGAGIWRGERCDYSPDHYRLTAWTALAGGVHGWNWYMLAERDNWQGAPINSRGVRDPALEPAFRDAARAFGLLRGAPAPSVSCGVTWSWAYHQTAATERRRVDDPLFAALHELGIEYDFVDVDRPQLTPAPRLLLVAGELEDPAPVWRHAEQGGDVVMFQRLLPGVPRPDGTSHHAPQALEVSLGFRTDRPVFAYREVSGEPIRALQRPWSSDADLTEHVALAVGRAYVTGSIAAHGRGRVLVLGCSPSRDALLAVHRRLGVPIPALPLTPGVQVALRGRTLIALNPGSARSARIALGEREVTLELPRCSGIAWDVELQRPLGS